MHGISFRVSFSDGSSRTAQLLVSSSTSGFSSGLTCTGRRDLLRDKSSVQIPIVFRGVALYLISSKQCQQGGLISLFIDGERFCERPRHGATPDLVLPTTKTKSTSMSCTRSFCSAWFSTTRNFFPPLRPRLPPHELERDFLRRVFTRLPIFLVQQGGS